MCALRSVLFLSLACLMVAAVVLLVPYTAEAQGAAESEEPVLVVRTYEVGDLILSVPDYPYSGNETKNPNPLMGGGMGGMGGGMGGMGMGGGMMSVEDSVPGDVVAQMGMGGGNVPARARSVAHAKARIAGQRQPMFDSPRVTMEDLVDTIMSLVAPGDWVASSGGPGDLTQLGTMLVVRQTPEVHKQIQDLLAQLRKGLGGRKTVAIDARWLLLNSDDLDRLASPEERGGPKIDRKVLAEYTRRPTSIRGLTNCFNGQLVYLVSGTRRNVVSGYIPVVGSLERPERRETSLASLGGGARIMLASQSGGMTMGGAPDPFAADRGRSVGYQPITTTMNFGTLLEIRPTLVPGDNTAIVDLRSTITGGWGTAEATSPEQRRGKSSLTPEVDRVAVETQELANTLCVPLGRPVLVGGLTYAATSAGSSAESRQAATNAETPQLYLILELR